MRRQKVNISTLAALGLTAGFIVASTAVFSQSVAAQEGHSLVAESLPEEKTVGKLEPIVAFTGSMPTGVTVSQDECSVQSRCCSGSDPSWLLQFFNFNDD
jgi:hypothetical protein